MDSLHSFILEIYRAAQDTPPEEFQDLALEMLKVLVPFRSAIWSNAQFTSDKNLSVHGMHLHNEPWALIDDIVTINRKHSTAVEAAANTPGVARIFYAPLVYRGPSEADIRDYVKRYGHENNLLISDIAARRSRGEWISLYRPDNDSHFNEREADTVTLLTPHLVEAVAINRALAFGKVTVQESELAGLRALVYENGVIVHCGRRFSDMLHAEWPEWRGNLRLPQKLMECLASKGCASIANGSHNVTIQRLDGMMLLTARKLPALTRLSPRERAVAHLFGGGKSYKEIAKSLHVAPATVRNFIQHIYRKLGIDNKAALARMLENEL